MPAHKNPSTSSTMARLPASVTDRLDGFKVHEIKTMGKHSNDAEARALLVLVTRQVQPIMVSAPRLGLLQSLNNPTLACQCLPSAC